MTRSLTGFRLSANFYLLAAFLMSLHSKFTVLNLEPALPDHPLSLSALRDYWTLLYWLLYNPHALRLYLQKYAANPRQAAAGTLGIVTRLHLQTAVLTLLVYLLGVMLSTLYVGMTQWLTLDQIVFSMIGAAVVGLVMIAVINIIYSWFWSYPTETSIFSFLTGIGAIVIYWYLTHPTSSVQPANALVDYWLSFNLLSGTFFGLLANTLISLIWRRDFHGAIEYGLSLAVFVGLLFMNAWVANSFYREFAIGVPLFNLSALPSFFTLLNFFSALLAYIIATLRPLDWLRCHLSLPALDDSPPSTGTLTYIPRVALLAPAFLQLTFTSWLKQDWERAIANFDQIWRYTNLRRSVVKAIRQQMTNLQEDAAEKMVALIDPAKGYRWTLDDLFVDELFWPSARRDSFAPWWLQLRQLFSSTTTWPSANTAWSRPTTWHGGELPMNNPAEASLAALLYLEHLNPAKAVDGFKIATKSPLAREMAKLCETLKTLSKPDQLIEKVTEFKLPPKPEEPLRQETWDALFEFRSIVSESWLYSRCNKNSTNRIRMQRSVDNRLKTLHTKLWPFPEHDLIVEIATRWRPQLAVWFNASEAPQRPKKFEDNPYEPDESLKKGDKLFQKRKKEQAKLQGAYIRNLTLLIYGQPLIGKTSLLNNVDSKDLKIRPPIHIGLEALGHPSMPVSLQLLRILGQRLQGSTGLPPPTDTGNVAAYYTEFNNYLYQICDMLMPYHLIIQIDHLEYARQLTRFHSNRNQSITSAVPAQSSTRSVDLAEIFTFLTNLPINLKNLTVMFIGRVTPAEFDELANNPAPIRIPSVHVSFLEKSAVGGLLNGPIANAIARFEKSASEAIYYLTNGHPMLIQMIAALMIDQFNELLENKASHPDPVFTVDDINALIGATFSGVILDPGDSQAVENLPSYRPEFIPAVVSFHPFWTQCHEYFEACVREASQRFSEGETILRILARRKEGFTPDELTQTALPVSLSRDRLNQILEELDEQDQLIKEEDGHYRVAVELLRIYLLHTVGVDVD